MENFNAGNTKLKDVDSKLLKQRKGLTSLFKKHKNWIETEPKINLLQDKELYHKDMVITADYEVMTEAVSMIDLRE